MDISLNTKYLVLLKVTDKNKFLFIAREFYRENSNSLKRHTWMRPLGYLILDLSQDTDDRLRFRTNIFSTDHLPIIYSPISDVTNEIK